MLNLSFLNRQPNLLTARIRKEIKRSGKKPRFSFFGRWFEQMYVPSWESLIVVLVILLPLFVFSHIQRMPSLNLGLNYQNLIAVLSGVGAIIFALIIFVAESLRDDETKDRARVLLRESMLFPLTVGEILVFLNLLWFDVNIWSVVPIFLVAIFTIVSLWRLIDVLLSKVKFYKKRLRLLKDRIERSIDLAINERFGDNILLQILGEGKTGLSYYPFSVDDEKDSHHCFYGDTPGVIEDIRLDKLDEFAKLVENEANKNGYSFYKHKVKPSEATASNQDTPLNVTPATYNHSDRQYLNKKYRDRIDEEDMVLLAIDRRTVTDVAILEHLRKLAKEIFVIGKEENFSEEVSMELAGLKDQFVAAILEKKLGKIEELTKTYIGLAESFLEMITRYGGGYSYEQAKKERNNFFFERNWLNIQWLVDSVQDIIEKAIESHDQQVISKTIFLPISIAIRAIKYGDQYLYQEFVRFPSRIYWLALKESDETLRNFMVDRCWRNLKEVTDFYIENQLSRKINNVEKLAEYSDFSIPIFHTFQDLIKTAFEKRDATGFREFLTQFQALYRRFNEDQEFVRYNDYDLSGARSEEEKKIIEEKLALHKERQRVSQKIKERKQQIIFGVAAWILEKLRQNPQNADLKTYFDGIRGYLPSKIVELTEDFNKARGFNTEDFWGWDNWETIPDGHVHVVDFHSKLDRLYCVRALHILRGVTEEAAATIELPHSRDLAFLIEERSGSLWAILSDVENHPETWEFVIDAAEASKAAMLKTLLKKAEVAQKKDEEEQVKDATVDPDKLTEFKKSFQKAFLENAIIRNVVTEEGSFVDHSKVAEPNVKAFGYNQIDEKAAFIKDWYVHYGGWGENYGRGMGQSENQIIWREMLTGAEGHGTAAKNEIVSKLEELLPKLGTEDAVIIESLGQSFEYEAIRNSESFSPRWAMNRAKLKFDDNPWCTGYLEIKGYHIPIFHIFVEDQDLQNFLLLVSVKSFGKLTQYLPTDTDENKPFVEGFFELKVIDLNENAPRAKLMAQNPPWLQETIDKDGYLRQRVLLNLYEKLEFKVDNKKSAFKLFISDIPTQEDAE